MAKNLFTREFYVQLFNAIEESVKNSNNVPEDSRSEHCASGYVDGDEFQDDPENPEEIYFECSVVATNEWEDESFDHAFGTWHDPFPHYEFAGIESVDDMHVYVDDEEVQGYDEDKLWEQFYLYEVRGFKAGELVCYQYKNGRYYEWSKEPATFMYYDQYNFKYIVKLADGKLKEVNTIGHLKKENNDNQNN